MPGDICTDITGGILGRQDYGGRKEANCYRSIVAGSIEYKRLGRALGSIESNNENEAADLT
jgi:hypothetical protein